MAFVPETFILYPEKLNFASDKAAYTYMKRYIFSLYICITGCLAAMATQRFAPLSSPKRETRAVWLTTFSSLDWPKNKATSPAGIKAQQDELCRILDRLKEVNINTVLLQTRVRGSVIYPSAIEPWDGCLTGTPGRAPGYDPLAFAVRECHKRGMELHAWLVAIPCFKVSAATRMGNRSVLKTHPKLCVRHGDSWYLDPGQPETADYLASLCREIAANYDVDGIHFDYIRYPENAVKFNDASSYRKYGKRQNKADWRRDNMTRCVQTMYRAVKVAKPWVKVSSSPVGKFSDLSRYPSYNWNAYSAVYQDAQGWLREGIQDMLFPMMYFRGNHFYPFAIDWKENDYGRPVVPGLGIYFLSPEEKDWPLEDITRELYFTRSLDLGGQAFFRYAYLNDNHKGLFDFLKDVYYPFPALPSACNSLDSIPPERPENLHKSREAQTYVLRWSPSVDNLCGKDVRYNVYASRTSPVDITTAQNLIAVNVDSCSLSINGEFCALNGISFAVTAIDRFGNESEPAQLPSGWSDRPNLSGRFLPHDSQTLDIPEQDSPYVAVVDAYGRIVSTAPYSRRVRIGHLAKGLYEIRTLAKKGRSKHIGYFIK